MIITNEDALLAYITEDDKYKPIFDLIQKMVDNHELYTEWFDYIETISRRGINPREFYNIFVNILGFYIEGEYDDKDIRIIYSEDNIIRFVNGVFERIRIRINFNPIFTSKKEVI